VKGTTSVCEGEYNQKEIVTDQLILNGNEIDRRLLHWREAKASVPELRCM